MNEKVGPKETEGLTSSFGCMAIPDTHIAGANHITANALPSVPSLEPNSSSGGASANTLVLTEPESEIAPAPFPPKQGKPPSHYLKGPREPWRPWINAEQSNMGPIGAKKERF